MAQAEHGVPWYLRAGVWVGIATGPGTFTVGGVLSSRLPLLSLLLVVPLGALALAGLTVAQGVVSRRRRQASTERAIAAFGPRLGNGLLNLIVLLGTIGWGAFYAGLAGFSLASLLHLPGWVGSLLVAAGIFVLNEIGIDRWNWLVWLTAASTMGLALFTLAVVGKAPAPDAVSGLTVGDFFWGAGSVIAYGMLFALRVSDFAWDLRDDFDVVKAGAALFFPLVIFLGIGAIVFRSVGDWNIADVLGRTESADLGQIFLVLAIIAPSMSGIHSGILAMDRTLPWRRRQIAVLYSSSVFVLGAIRFDRQLLLFLDLLGVSIIPALLIMLALAATKNPPSRLVLMLAWGLGSLAGLLAKTNDQLSPVLVGAGVTLAVLALSYLRSLATVQDVGPNSGV